MNILIVNVIIILFLENIICQVCNETRSIFREVPETYRFSYIETYEEPCLVFCSVKTRTSVNVTTRIVQLYQNVTVYSCCEGYIKDDSYEDGLYCEPICDPPCQNGYCRRPNQCGCEPGYAPNPLNPHICQFLCLEDCVTPDCISIKNPQCSPNDTETLSPTCTEPCFNGTCIAPGVCECFDGYYAISPNVCQPDSNFYGPGTYIIPNRTECDPGWQWKCGSCQPICNECNHGTCVSPERCECDHGYVKSEKGKCEPYCTSGCANGKCVGSEICICNPGWYMVEDGGECIAHCNSNCQNGHCVAPNVCKCHPGYQLDTTKEGPGCVLSSKECDGPRFTVATCECNGPYEVRYATDDDGACDCFDHCTDSSRECTKASCWFKNEVDDTTPTVIEEEAVRMFDVNSLLQVDDTASTFPTTEKKADFITEPNSKNTSNNSKTHKEPAYWIYGVAAVAVLIIALILVFIVKRKCFKKRILNTPDKNDDSVVHYINQFS